MSQVRLLCKLNDDSPQGWNVQIGRSFRGAETMASLLAPGTVAPDFTARDQEGNPVRLAGRRGRPPGVPPRAVRVPGPDRGVPVRGGPRVRREHAGRGVPPRVPGQIRPQLPPPPGSDEGA